MPKPTPNQSITGPDDSVIVEVIRTKGDEVVKKEMTFGEWKNLKRQPGYKYSAFQRGFSQFKTEKS